jgi:hypothetical protein
VRSVVLICILLALAACDDAQVKQCETSIVDKLKAPSSYKRINITRSQIDSSIHKPPYDSVTIYYDAVNAYNAPLRGDETCFFEPGTDTRMNNPFEAEVRAQLDAALAKSADAALDHAADAANAETAADIASDGANPGQQYDPRDACLENATTTDAYAECDRLYGAGE